MDLLSDAPDIWQQCWDKRSTIDDRRSIHPGQFEQPLSGQAVKAPQQLDNMEDQHSINGQCTPVAELEVARA
jgi:hypothetical protein